MLQWFAENAGTIIVSLLLAVLVAAIIKKLADDHRQGKTSCGSRCGSCPMASACRRRRS